MSRERDWTFLHDKDLILEDGTHCSAKHCCDPIDHQIEDHPPPPLGWDTSQ